MESVLDCINSLVKCYVPAIVNSVLLSVRAGCCNRDMTAGECDQVIDAIKQTSERFVKEYKAMLAAKGLHLSEEDEGEICDEIAQGILITASVMVSDIGIELGSRVHRDALENKNKKEKNIC